jgi:hypothetical protein
VDLTKLGTGYRIAAGAAVLLFIDMWLSWYGVGGQLGELAQAAGITGVDTTANAFQAFDLTDLLMLLTVAVAIGATVLHLQNMDGAVPFPAPLALVGIAGYTAVIILYRIVNQPGPNDVIDVKFGAYLGFVLCALVAIGGFLALTEGKSSGAPAASSPPATPPAL